MTISKRSRYAAAGVICALAAITMSGCTSSKKSTSDGPTSTPSTTASSTAPASGCPVDEKTLEAAFNANSSVSSAILLGKGFVDIKCAGNFAIARATPTDVDPARVLFQYDPATSTWSAVTGGTSFDCSKFASAAIATQLGC